MRRAMLFLTRFSLGLWGVLFCSFLLLLWLNAPVGPSIPFSSVALDAQPAVYLPTRIFDCTETSQQIQCQTTAQSRVLALTWQKDSKSQSEFAFPSRCMATYDGKSVNCDNKGPSSVIGLPDAYEVSNLGLSPSQLQSIRRRYWGADMLASIGEPRLYSIGNRLALVGGVIVACFVWLQPGFFSNFFVSLSCGFFVFLLSWIFLPVPDPISPVHWIWPSQNWAIFTGPATFLTALFISSRAQPRLFTAPKTSSKVIASLLSGGGIAALVSVFFFVMFLTLWYAD